MDNSEGTMTDKMLYDGTVCRLCSQDLSFDEHVDDCPGAVIDGLVYEITVSGPNCGRGCCGYTRFSIEGSDLRELVVEAERQASTSNCISPNFSVKVVCEVPDTESMFEEARKARVAKELVDKAKSETENTARENAEARASALEQLEADKADLTPEGYARRKVEIDRLHPLPSEVIPIECASREG